MSGKPRKTHPDDLPPRDPDYSLDLPMALDLEEAVLGAIMAERNAFQEALRLLKAEDFFEEKHVAIYKACLDLNKENAPIDMRTVVAKLRHNVQLELAGGAYYIAELTSRVSSAANLAYHASIIKEMSVKRGLISLGQKMIQKGFRIDTDMFDLLEEFTLELSSLEPSGATTHITMKEGLNILATEIQSRNDENGGINGIRSGFLRLDRITTGWQNSDLIIIAGRPGMAKTTLAQILARNAAIMDKAPVALFSMEMSTIQLVKKFVSSETQINFTKVKGEKFGDHDWHQFMHKTNELAAAPIYLDDSAALSIVELRSRCRRMKDELGIRLIIIDYLQLMKGETRRGGSREEEIASISRSLKQIAKELNVPVICLSSMSRSVETRGGNKKPIMSDLRESGAIESDADIIMLLWRPEYYKITIDEDGTPYPPGYTEIDIAKNRSGVTVPVKVQFLGAYSSFRDLAGPADIVKAQTPEPPPAPTSDNVNEDLPF